MNKQPIFLKLLCILLYFGLIAGCNQTDKEPHSETDKPEETLSIAQLFDYCGETIFAALYHLPGTHQFFENHQDLIAQPAYYFSESLNNEEKEKILIQLNRLYRQETDKNRWAERSRRLTQWCDAHETMEKLQNHYGYEEFLAGLKESHRFDYLFLPHLNSPLFQSDDFSSFDKVASLSSAQGQQIINTLISDLSMQNTTLFEEDLATLIALYES